MKDYKCQWLLTRINKEQVVAVLPGFKKWYKVLGDHIVELHTGKTISKSKVGECEEKRAGEKRENQL